MRATRLISLNVTTLCCFTNFFLPVHAQNIDINTLRSINQNRNIHLDPFFRDVSFSVYPVAVAAPVFVYTTGTLQHNKDQKRNGVAVAEGLLLSVGVTTAVKYIVQRKRPYESYPDIQRATSGGSGPSFPSGHASTAFETATALSLTYRKWYVIAPSYAWAATVAYSRMHLGVHYPSDVLVGALVGSGAAVLCFKAQRWISHQ